jgi:ribokinase
VNDIQLPYKPEILLPQSINRAIMSVICAGHANWDVTLLVDHLPAADSEATIHDQRSGGGGSAANTAVSLSQLGVSSGIIASVASDRDGRAAHSELRENGVDTMGLQIVDGQTAVKYLVIAPDGEAFVLGTDGANERIDPDAIPASFIESADHLHLTGQNPETASVLAERATDAGLSVSFDPGRRCSSRSYDRTLALADIVFLNRRETNQIEVPDDSIIVRKHGSGGATAETPHGTYHHSGFPVDAIDTTGAGDAFAAGFLSMILTESDTTSESEFEPEYKYRDESVFEPEIEFSSALAVGNACGALTASAKGTRPGLSWQSIDVMLDSE